MEAPSTFLNQQNAASMPKKRSAKTPQKIAAGDELPEDVVELFAKHQKYLAAGKANYAKADKILEQLLARCETGVALHVPAIGKCPAVVLRLVDQFAEKNTVWAGSSCKRFKIEEQKVKPQDL